MSKTIPISIRLPEDVVHRIPTDDHRSRYIVAAVREKLARDEQERLGAQLACLADDPEANDVSDFADAQRKVIRRGD